ncbi:I78 family peptidase inhibitor [Amaricoccus sp.]|uniref:I78 family peptidase inhibitor n=1 Tax=Amaricoccus sp. TaxID=1872485 RepID=UPI001B4C68ED|nr:I78 family peptidase inhibitor [Amaricoccus sp.]MBP7240587.1 hypothetical protein [Amaricoccus sp.]
MTMPKALAAAALLATLAACAQEGATEAADVDVSKDACGAAGHQNLVGTSVGALDAASLPEPRRVIFPGQPVTMDFRAERLNVEIGPDDKVARVFCG